MSFVHRFWLRMRNVAWPRVLRVVLRARTNEPLVRLGSDYGGWWVPSRVLADGVTAYCAGAGEDITFDLALFAAGCSVTTFDPTPRAIDHVKQHMPQSERFRFVPVGWWEQEDVLRFYSPQNADHVSHSIVNLQKTDTYFEAPVRPVRALMAELDDERVDVIKMDIEGAEHVVLRSLLTDGPLPEVLCVEFDQPQPSRDIVQAVRRLRERGYQLAKIDGWNYTFLREQGAS